MSIGGVSLNQVDSLNTREGKISKKRQAAAVLTGGTIATLPAAFVASDLLKTKSPKELKKAADLMRYIAPDIDTFQNVKEIADKVLLESGLKDKGVKIKVVTPENLAMIQEEISSFAKNPIDKKTVGNFVNMFEVGANAGFLPKNNSVYITDKSLYSSVFHELGHAMNRNLSKFGLALQKSRMYLTPLGVPVAGLGLFAASLFHKNKPENVDQPKSAWEKTKDFVKNHAGKITFLTTLPMVLEEALATSNGLLAVKKHLDPSQFKALKAGYTKCLGSYVLVSVGLSGAVGLANMIATRIQNKK